MATNDQCGWFKAIRSDEALELVRANPNAFVLAYMIAARARWSGGFNRHGLEPGECLLGDYGSYGMSEQQYRTAKEQLARWKFATFKTTNKGTIGKLIDTRLFDPLNYSNNEQTNGRVTDSQRTGNGRVTTNEEGKKETDTDTDSVELPPGFPKTEAESIPAAAFVGCPESFAVKTWVKAMGRRGRDAKDIPIRSWRYYLKNEYRYEQERPARTPGRQTRVTPDHTKGF